MLLYSSLLHYSKILINLWNLSNLILCDMWLAQVCNISSLSLGLLFFWTRGWRRLLSVMLLNLWLGQLTGTPPPAIVLQLHQKWKARQRKWQRDAHIRQLHPHSDIVLHLVPWPRVLDYGITTEKYTIFSAVQSLFLLYCYTSYYSFIRKGFRIDFIATNIVKIINVNCIITVCIKWLCAIIWHTKNIDYHNYLEVNVK